MNYMKIKGEFNVNEALQHSDRGQEGVSDKQHSNYKIDPTRTHLNYELKDRGGLTAIDYHTKRIKAIVEETKQRTGKTIRKDAVTLCSWAVTAPQDLPRDKLNDFFRESYLWFSKRYGVDNIVTAAVHMDETTPHMHLQFTPIVTDKKGNRKLCAKDLETPTSLKKAHQILQKHLTDKLGCEVNLLNGATENGNKTILELKNEELQKQIEELQAQIAKLQEVKADEVGRVAKAFQGIADKIKLGHKLNPSEMQVFEKTAKVIEQLQKVQAEAEQAQKTAESHEKALQQRERDFDSEVHAKVQELSESLTAGFNRRLQEINQQAEKKIRAAEQKRQKAEQEQTEQKRQKEIALQQLQEQKQLQQQAEQLREQAVEVATKYAYLVDEIGIPDNLRGFESDLWQQLQEVNPDEQQQQKMTDDFELI